MTIPDKEIRKANRLINEKSPYLLQHAYNPVEWYPWSHEAFEKAKKEDKPIFLSIGYSTCHWCHVMERESFEDEEVAELLNQDYVAIKVDREERPDIDHIYMEVCQGLTGSGGWPLTIIMTPGKKPFFAATYIPKNSRSGLSGLMQLLPRVASLWRQDRGAVLESSQRISDWLQKDNWKESSQGLDSRVFDRAFVYFKEAFDKEYGGFGSQPKFPTPHNLYFLLRYYRYKNEPEALKIVEKTLLGMYQGGIYDHIGFGFSRYSTDRIWLAPHFEKMLYDNALLAIAYLEAFQLTRKEIYARTAREIFTYIMRDMTSPEGAFYSAEDADSEGEEGRFYLWSPEEVKAVLGEQDGIEFCELYGIKPGGNFEGRSIANLLGGLPDETERERIGPWRERIFAERGKRVHPYKDDKILTAWNGMMIAALAYGARVLNDDSYLQAAAGAAAFILDKMRREDGRLLARYRDGEALYPAYSLDYACLVWGLIELYQSGFEPQYLKLALELTRDSIRLFWDDDKAGFFVYGKDAEELLVRPKEDYDGAIPADNSVAAWNLLRLARLTGDNTLEGKAALMFNYFADSINQLPAAHSFFLMAALYYEEPGREIVIVGEREREETRAMFQVINQQFAPSTLVVLKQPGGDSGELEGMVPFADDMIAVNGGPTAYLCSGFACQQPVNKPEELREMLLH